MKKTGEEFPCAYCGEPVYVPQWKQDRSKTGRFYCDKECHDKHQEEYMSDIQRDMSDGEYRTCVICGDKFWNSPSRDQIHCSHECSNSNPEVQIKKGASQEENGQWKGGISDDYHRRLAEDNMEKKCVECGSTDNLDVHHKNGDHQDNRVENLEYRCRSCHIKEHDRNPELPSVHS